MQLNITTDYAIRCVAHISKKSGITTATELSESIDVSKEFVPVIMKNLRKVGIVESVRGVKGGFVLGRLAKDISLYDIISVMEKSMTICKCIDNEGICTIAMAKDCKLKEYYKSIQDDIQKKLSSIKITDIM